MSKIDALYPKEDEELIKFNPLMQAKKEVSAIGYIMGRFESNQGREEEAETSKMDKELKERIGFWNSIIYQPPFIYYAKIIKAMRKMAVLVRLSFDFAHSNRTKE